MPDVTGETFKHYLAEAENGLCKIPRRVAADMALAHDALRQQVERLEREKAELLDDIKCSFGNTNAAIDDYNEALARAERAEAELARIRTVDDAMIERAFYANHDPRAEPSSVERSKLRKAITAALEAGE